MMRYSLGHMHLQQEMMEADPLVIGFIPTQRKAGLMGLNIGVFGGTFDPVHYGHLLVAEQAAEKAGLDSILFMPSGIPPHKPLHTVSPAIHRFSMVNEAVAGNAGFSVSRVEIDRPGLTYTIDTLRELSASFDNSSSIRMIIGADVLDELETWRDFQEVSRLCGFVAITRPGIPKERFISQAERLSAKYGMHVCLIETPLMGISSSDIRKRVFEGLSIRYMTPETVIRYIEEHRLYKQHTE
jgi:nicotinate-nucleotide adenylyltransferase